MRIYITHNQHRLDIINQSKQQNIDSGHEAHKAKMKA